MPPLDYSTGRRKNLELGSSWAAGSTRHLLPPHWQLTPLPQSPELLLPCCQHRTALLERRCTPFDSWCRLSEEALQTARRKDNVSSFFYPLQAQPAPTLHEYDLLMHVSPHALPVVQILQQFVPELPPPELPLQPTIEDKAIKNTVTKNFFVMRGILVSRQ